MSAAMVVPAQSITGNPTVSIGNWGTNGGEISVTGDKPGL